MHILGVPWWPSGIGAFSAEGAGPIPDWGTKIPQSTWHSNPLPRMHVLSWGTASSLSSLSFVLGRVVHESNRCLTLSGQCPTRPILEYSQPLLLKVMG